MIELLARIRKDPFPLGILLLVLGTWFVVRLHGCQTTAADREHIYRAQLGSGNEKLVRARSITIVQKDFSTCAYALDASGEVVLYWCGNPIVIERLEALPELP